MAVFISLATDAFADTFTSNRLAKQAAARAGTANARRPTRGLEIKDDTYAILKVVQADGTEIPLLDSGSSSGTNTQYANFILQSVQEARMEKHQIVETFGEPYIFFFGESPRFLDVQAILVDSNDFNWYAEFWTNYNKYLRGTRLVEMGARCYLFYDDNIVEGYMLMAQASKVSEQPLMARLTFRLYLTNYSNVTLVDTASAASPQYPVRPGASADTAGAQQQANDGATQTVAPDGGLSLADAMRGYANGSERTKPLRGLIADNLDEFTGQVFSSTNSDLSPFSGGSAFSDEEGDQAGQPDATNLHQTATQQLSRYGANINNPDLYNRLGLGPRFGAVSGFGLMGSGGGYASFGVQGGSSFGSGFRGGMNGGLGFVGTFNSSSLSTQPTTGNNFYGAQNNFGNYGTSYQNGIYGNGVPVQTGIIAGTGIGGGIPGGMGGGMGPGGPGTLTQYQGGKSYAQANGFGSMQGYGQGLSASGASVSVGGAPSAFSMTSAPGTFNQYGTTEQGFFVGPNGTQTFSNNSGIFA